MKGGEKGEGERGEENEAIKAVETTQQRAADQNISQSPGENKSPSINSPPPSHLKHMKQILVGINQFFSVYIAVNTHILQAEGRDEVKHVVAFLSYVEYI